MKHSKNIKLLVLFLILIVIGIIFLFFQPNINGFQSNINEIPKKIWCYWDRDVPDVVQKCLESWRYFNPDYTITLVNKENLSTYVPGVDFSKMKHINETPQKFSDMVRLHILAQEGGFWIDATIICQKSFDWIQNIQKKSGSEFVGYYIDSFTFPEYINTSPVIENWFFACVKNSRFVNDWLNEFTQINNYDTVEKYVDDVKSKVNIQNINMPYYLSMHVSAQKILQSIGKYKVDLLKAEDTALKYLVDNNWNSEKSVEQLLQLKYIEQPIIKLRGNERTIIEKMNYKDYFMTLFEENI